MSEPPNLPPPPPEPPSLPPPPVEQQQYQDQDQDQDQDPEVAAERPPIIGHAPINAGHPNLDWPVMVAGFCFQSAVTIAAQSLQNDDKLPKAFHMLCLAMVVAVAAICVSKYTSTKFAGVARALENVGVLSGVTAFLIAVTVSSPLCLKIISWIIFALSIVAILVFNRR